MDFIFSQLLLWLGIVFILILPGWFFLHAVTGTLRYTLLERSLLAVPLSIVINTFLLIIMNLLHIPLTQRSIFLVVTGIILICVWIARQRTETRDDLPRHVRFTRKQIITIIVLIGFAIFIKSVYLTDTVFPTSTDLGHHMFWVQKIVTEQALPPYEKIEIITQADGHYALSEPQPIADFIIGEHTALASLSILAKQSVLSAFPTLFLFFINIVSIVAIFVLATRLFAQHKNVHLIAMSTLLLIGPLYAISGAQAKFASGGVIGNLLGNLLIPTTLYFFYRAFYERSASFLFVGILSAIGLAYTHHLSAFVLLFILLFSLVFLLLLSIGQLKSTTIRLFALFRDPFVIAILLASVVFVFSVSTPSYLNVEAVSSSVGTPEKTTRTGLTPMQLMYKTGEARFLLGLLGTALLTLIALSRYFPKKYGAFFKNARIDRYALALILGWSIALLIMSLAPALLQINIISSRIANYLAFPFAITGGFFLAWLFVSVRVKGPQTIPLYRTPYRLTFLFASILLLFTLGSGLHDNAVSLKKTPNVAPALATFEASAYLAQNLGTEEWLLKDHIYLTADTWSKIFFTRDYSYPLSRSYLKRYDKQGREQCTRVMISEPNTELAERCFDDLGVTTLMVDPREDSSQFERSEEFTKIYSHDNVAIYQRSNESL